MPFHYSLSLSLSVSFSSLWLSHAVGIHFQHLSCALTL